MRGRVDTEPGPEAGGAFVAVVVVVVAVVVVVVVVVVVAVAWVPRDFVVEVTHSKEH